MSRLVLKQTTTTTTAIVTITSTTVNCTSVTSARVGHVIRLTMDGAVTPKFHYARIVKIAALVITFDIPPAVAVAIGNGVAFFDREANTNRRITQDVELATNPQDTQQQTLWNRQLARYIPHIQAGTVTLISSIMDVKFEQKFPDANYSIAFGRSTSVGTARIFYTAKTASGFRINAGSPGGPIDWIAIR